MKAAEGGIKSPSITQLANAWDAHIEAGCPDKPIQVVLPTDLEPSLIIRDYGPGITHHNVKHVFAEYGASTKRDENDQVGAFGTGGKAGFAYSDTFTVTVWQAGEKRIYIAHRKESGAGKIPLVHAEACDPAESGVEIKIPANPADVDRFYSEAETLYPFFQPLPNINIEMKTAVQQVLKTGFVTKKWEKSSLPRWVGVMGCIPYRIDWTAVSDLPEYTPEVGKFTQAYRGGLFFDIGSVDLAVSREGLEYTDRTRQIVLKQLLGLIDEIGAAGQAILADDKLTDLQKRVACRKFTAETGLPLRDESGRYWSGHSVEIYTGKLLQRRVKSESTTQDQQTLARWTMETITYDGKAVYDKPLSFHMSHRVEQHTGSQYRLESTTHVPVDLETKVVIYDTNRHRLGYVRSNREIVLTPYTGFTAKMVEREWELFASRARVRGIPVILASTRDYVPFSSRAGASKSNKYSSRTFVLDAGDAYEYRSKKSDNWIKADVPMDPESPYVVLEQFASQGIFGIKKYQQLWEAAKTLFGEDCPPLFGVRSTRNKPVRLKDVPGTPAADWAPLWIQEQLALHPEVRVHLEARQWSWSHSELQQRELMRIYLNHLHGDHPIARFFKRIQSCSKFYHKLGYFHRSTLDDLANFLKDDDIGTVRSAVEYLRSQYPLWVGYGMTGHSNEVALKWLAYIDNEDRRRR